MYVFQSVSHYNIFKSLWRVIVSYFCSEIRKISNIPQCSYNLSPEEGPKIREILKIVTIAVFANTKHVYIYIYIYIYIYTYIYTHISVKKMDVYIHIYISLVFLSFLPCRFSFCYTPLSYFLFFSILFVSTPFDRTPYWAVCLQFAGTTPHNTTCLQRALLICSAFLCLYQVRINVATFAFTFPSSYT